MNRAGIERRFGWSAAAVYRRLFRLHGTAAICAFLVAFVPLFGCAVIWLCTSVPPWALARRDPLADGFSSPPVEAAYTLRTTGWGALASSAKLHQYRATNALVYHQVFPALFAVQSVRVWVWQCS